MNAKRADLLLQSLFVRFVLFLLFVFILCLVSGCSSRSSGDHALKTSWVPAADAREAGSMALYMQGLLYESTTNSVPDQAVAAYSGALELDPGNLSALSALVNTLSQQKRYKESYEVLSRSLSRFPESTDLRQYAVKLASHLNKSGEAAEFCRQILISDPTNQPIAQAAIKLYFDAGKERKALSTLEGFTAQFANKEALNFSLDTIFSIYQEGHNSKQALKCSEIALQYAESAPERSNLMIVQAYCHLENAQTNNAMRLFSKAYCLNPQKHLPLAHLGSIYASQPASLRILEEASGNKSKRIPPPELILGYAYNTLEQPAKAAHFLESYYQRQMRKGFFADKEFYLLLGSIYESYKEYAKVDKLFIDAACAFPDDTEILNFAAYLWAERSVNLEKALLFTNRVLKQEPDNPAFLDTKGWILHKMGRDFEALQILLKACALDNQETIILDHTGDVLCAVGNEILAIDFWKKSYLKNPQQSIASKLTGMDEPLPKR